MEIIDNLADIQQYIMMVECKLMGHCAFTKYFFRQVILMTQMVVNKALTFINMQKIKCQINTETPLLALVTP